MTPKEVDYLNMRIDKRAKDMLKEESEKANLSMTEYLERLIEGTLPDRLEAKMEAIRGEILKEIEVLRKEVTK